MEAQWGACAFHRSGKAFLRKWRKGWDEAEKPWECCKQKRVHKSMDKAGKEAGMFYNLSESLGNQGWVGFYSRCTLESVFADIYFHTWLSNSLVVPIKQVLLSMFYRTLFAYSGNLRTAVRLAPTVLYSQQVLFPLNLSAEEPAALSLPPWPINYKSPLYPQHLPSPPISEFTSRTDLTM